MTDEFPVIEKVIATHGWFGGKIYDLVLTREELLLVRVPKSRNRGMPIKAGFVHHVRVGDLGELKGRHESITIPYASVQSMHLHVPPVQPNRPYYRIGIVVAHGLPGGKCKKMRIAINARYYLLTKQLGVAMPQKLSDNILKRNELLAEYAQSVKSLMVDSLPPEVVKRCQWSIPNPTSCPSRI